MTIANQGQRLPRGPCGRRSTPLEAGWGRAVEQIRELWAAYRTDRGNLRASRKSSVPNCPWRDLPS